jgi:hypothetical protein
MTRQSTWTNADGLVVGFGPNIPERNVAGVYLLSPSDTLDVAFAGTFTAGTATIVVSYI